MNFTPLPLLLVLAAIPAGCASVPDIVETRGTAATLLATDPDASLRYIDATDPELRGDSPLQLLAAEACARAGQLDEAARRYDEVIARTYSPTLRDLALRNLAVVQLQGDHPEAAYATLGQLSERARKEPSTQRDLGVAAVAAGRLDRARVHFASLSADERARIARVLGSDFFAQP